MKIEEFKKGIAEFRETRLTSVDKSAMLEEIFKAPVESPYWNAAFTRFFEKPMATALLSGLFIISGTTLAYNAQYSLPGEVLYPIKTQVFEPILDQVHTEPLEKLEWEEKKIETRLLEAEELAKKNKLNERNTQELERKIEKSSAAFVKAAESVASSTATTTKGRDEKSQSLKDSLRQKLEEVKAASLKVDESDRNENDEDDERDEEKKKDREEKIQRIKDRAVKALEKKEEKREENSKRRGGD